MGCSFNGADRGHCITGDCPKHDGPRCHWHDVGQVHARNPSVHDDDDIDRLLGPAVIDGFNMPVSFQPTINLIDEYSLGTFQQPYRLCFRYSSSNTKISHRLLRAPTKQTHIPALPALGLHMQLVSYNALMA
jgi:hypothetical protein